MRIVLARLVLLPLLLAGCGNTLWADLVPAGVARTEAGPEPQGRALRVTVRGRASYATLVQETGERRLWRTGSHQVIETDAGRITATSGFGEVLAATRAEGPDPLAQPAALLDAPARARRMVDLMRADRTPDGMRFGVPVECTLRATRPEDPGLLLVEERCRTSGAGVLTNRFTNHFWVAEDGGAVLQSRQWIGPNAPILTVEFLSPAS